MSMEVKIPQNVPLSRGPEKDTTTIFVNSINFYFVNIDLQLKQPISFRTERERENNLLLFVHKTLKRQLLYYTAWSQKESLFCKIVYNETKRKQA